MVDLPFGGSVWGNIAIALRHVETIYKQETQALGLSIIEWYVLRALYEQDGQMPTQLAKAVGRAAISFSPILNHIERKGLIERRKHPNDRRAIKIHLTKQGQALKKQVAASAEQIESKLRQRFMDKDWQGYEAVVTELQTMTP